MQEVIALRHVGFEHLGTLAPLLTGRGFRVRYWDVGTTDLSTLDPLKADLLVVLGGPIGVYEATHYPYLNDELRLIERRLAAERPILGICLGAQLMAHALGSRVYPGRAKEIGWAPLRLTLEGMRSCLADLATDATTTIPVLHWHGDTFDLPGPARRLASTDLTENQSFAVGRHALGLQFHLEVDPSEIERWLIGHAHEIAATADITPQALRADTAQYGATLAKRAALCLSRWLTESRLLPTDPERQPES